MNKATWKQQSVIGTLVSMGNLSVIEAPKSQNEDEPYGHLTISEASALISLGKLRKDYDVSCISGKWEMWSKDKRQFVPINEEVMEICQIPKVYAESETEVVL